MLERISRTLVRVRMFYGSYPKKAYETAVYSSFAALLFGLTMSLAVGYTVWSIQHVPASMAFMDLGEFIISGLFWNGAGTISGFALLLLGLFFIRMQQVGDRSIKQRSFSDLLKGITTNNWSAFLIALIVLFIIEVILFLPLFDHDESGWGAIRIDAFDLEMGTNKTARYLAWLNDVTALLKNYVGYILIIYLLLADKRISLTPSGLRPLWSSILTVIILMFVFDALFAQVYYFIATYVLPPLTIPFTGSMIPVVFTYMVAIITLAWFLPFIALLFIAPFDKTTQKDAYTS